MVATYRKQMRGWLRDEIEGKDEIALPDLANRAVLHFATNPTFVQGFMEEQLQPIVHTMAQQVMAESRPTPVLSFTDTVMTSEKFEEKVAAFKTTVWGNWMEHAGSRHVRLLRMDSTDLRMAAAERRGRGRTEFKFATLFDQIADGLEGGQVAEDRFTVDEIDALYRTIEDAAKGDVA